VLVVTGRPNFHPKLQELRIIDYSRQSSDNTSIARQNYVSSFSPPKNSLELVFSPGKSTQKGRGFCSPSVDDVSCASPAFP